MPRKKTSGQKREPTPDAYIGDIDNAQGWHTIVNILCDVYGLPDLATRSGLKKVHVDFDRVYRRLEAAYNKYPDNEKVTGGIVGICAKMCVDSILRTKLVDRGFLSMVTPLLSAPSSRHLALRSISAVTPHGGTHPRAEVAKLAPKLVQILSEHPDDLKGAELIIATLEHSLSALVASDNPSDVRLAKSLDMASIITAVTKLLRDPKATESSYLWNHAVDLFALSTLNFSDAFRACPEALKCLVANLRSKDWATRCSCLGGLIRLHRLEAEEDKRTLDPHIFMSRVKQGFPNHITDVLYNYGFDRVETFLNVRATADYQKAMMKCAQNRDYYALGLTLAELITRTEYSIAEGAFQDAQGTIMGKEITGLAFTMWSDALPHCAKVLRQRANNPDSPKDLNDLADILDIKYRILKQRIPDAISVATKALERNPNCAYFYYPMSLGSDSVSGLRAAKKGLKCPNTTPFVKFQLMYRAVEHSVERGLHHLTQQLDQAGKVEEGIAFLTCAFEDAKTYIAEAPPDAFNMKNVCYWYVILFFVIKGPEATVDSYQIKSTLSKLKIAEDIRTHYGTPPSKTNQRLTQQTIVDNYADAIKLWGDLIQKTDEHFSSHVRIPTNPDDELAAWIDDVRSDSDGKEAEMKCAHPKVNPNHVMLYQCSWCGNPSAVLRKCSGCNKTRYCDTGCQKRHWSEHKKNCLKKT